MGVGVIRCVCVWVCVLVGVGVVGCGSVLYCFCRVYERDVGTFRQHLI